MRCYAQLLVTFPWVVTSTGPGGGGYGFVCVFYEHSKAQPKVFLKKPVIEPAIPGLQGIALIHHTSAASGNFQSNSRYYITYS